MTKGKQPKKKKKTNPKFRSKFEKDFSTQLKRKRIDFDYESDNIPYVIEHKYKTDFSLNKKDGGIMYVETKGYLKSQDRRKYLAVKECNPDIDLRFVFQNASNKIRKGSSTTYGMWASKSGFKWSEKTIPADWIKELDR